MLTSVLGFGSLYAWEDARGCGALLDLDPSTIIDVWDQGAPGQWLAGVQDTVARGFQIAPTPRNKHFCHSFVSHSCCYIDLVI